MTTTQEPFMSQRAGYRPDIDGLRAIAVLAVIAFHFNPDFLPGGFAGVDIFFVISGYLITGNIVNGLNNNSFTLIEFYRRRTLRILPNLFLVVLATLIVGHFLLQPEDYHNLSLSGLASVMSVANIYFTYFLDTGYFAPDASQQALLHIWSLGVEEQFYLFWPLILMLAWPLVKTSAARTVLILVLCGCSFAYAQLKLDASPMFAYYMLPARAGELLIGALLAARSRHSRQTGRPMALFYSLAGALLVGYSLIWIDANKGFPGLNALPATLGAALLIMAGTTPACSPLSRLLASRPLVWIGLLSYSLYLWHWPVMAFYRYAYGEINLAHGLLLLATMLALSWLGYSLVEKPARSLKWSFRRIMASAVLPACVATSLLVGLIHASHGYALYWFDQDYKTALNNARPAGSAASDARVCQQTELTEDALNKSDCIINGHSEPEILLWGDSHAAHYVGLLEQVARHSGFSFRNAAHSACPPLLNSPERFVQPRYTASCSRSNTLVKQRLEQYSVLVLGAQWSWYAARDPEFMPELEQTLEQLAAQGKTLVLLGTVPRFKNINNECKRKELKALYPHCKDQAAGSIAQINSSLQELANRHPHVHYMGIDTVICPQGHCSNLLQGQNLYYDPGHLSMAGSQSLGRHLVEQGLVPAFFQQLKTARSHRTNDKANAHP